MFINTIRIIFADRNLIKIERFGLSKNWITAIKSDPGPLPTLQI